jgi:hypothetical protein
MVPVIIFRSDEEVTGTLRHITNAFRVTPDDDEPVTLGSYLSDRDSHLASMKISHWAIEDEDKCSFYTIVYDDDDVNDIPFGDILDITRTCRDMFKPKQVKPVMVVDPDTTEWRSHDLHRRLLVSAEELLAYLGADTNNLAIVDDMEALTNYIRPVERVVPLPVRMIRVHHPTDIIHAVMHLVGEENHARFHEPVPRTIPDAPRAKRELPEGYEERLREPEKATRDEEACITCCDNRKSIKLFPCEHMSLCDTCFESMMVSETCQKTCPECRGDIESFKSCGKVKRAKGGS